MVKMGEISPLHVQSVGPPWPLSFPVEVIHGYGYSGYGKPQIMKSWTWKAETYDVDIRGYLW